jgi:hypothetical protein
MLKLILEVMGVRVWTRLNTSVEHFGYEIVHFRGDYKACNFPTRSATVNFLVWPLLRGAGQFT